MQGKPVFHYNVVGVHRYSVAAPEKLAPGKHTVVLDFKYDGGLGKGGTAALKVDGTQVAEGKLERTIPFRISADETLDIGEDTGTPVKRGLPGTVQVHGQDNHAGHPSRRRQTQSRGRESHRGGKVQGRVEPVAGGKLN